MANRTTLSERKYKQLALQSLRNSLRLFRDSIILFEHDSFPSAFQLAVLALEEYAKAKWVDHYYYSSITNEGFPGEEFEQEWLKLLYFHTEKHRAFLWEHYEYSPRFFKQSLAGDLERKKQVATYVGLPKKGKRVDVNARVSTPEMIKSGDAKQMISLIARELRDVYRIIQRSESYFGIGELDEVMLTHEAMAAFSWKYRSGLKSLRFRTAHGWSKPSK